MTLHTLVLTHVTSVVKPVHIAMARSRVSKSRLKAELCFHRYVYLTCVPICNIHYDVHLRAKTTFEIWNFDFVQILTGIVEKQYVLPPFNFFLKLKFPIFSVHVNWIVFYVTALLFKFHYQEILRKICHVIIIIIITFISQ